MGSGALQGHRLNNTVNTQGCKLCNFPSTLPCGMVLREACFPLARKLHTVSVSWLSGTSLAASMGLLFPHLCFLGFFFLFFFLQCWRWNHSQNMS